MIEPSLFLDGKVQLYSGDCRDVLRSLPDASIDSVVTDPPYALVSISKRFGKAGSAPAKVPEGGSGAYARASAGFMGKQWDTGETAFAVEFWAEVLRVLKPGGHVAAFAGTRTYHRLACAIEDAGFEIRDQIGWTYGQGFPKSHNISRNLDAYRCLCEAISGGEESERCLQPVRNRNVSEAKSASERRREVLLSCLQEQGASTPGRQKLACDEGGEKPGLEGWSDVPETTRQLRERPVCEVPVRPALDGENGRLCDGAPPRHGEADRPASAAGRVRSSSRPRPAEQRGHEPGALAGQPKPQDGGAWPHCDRCGKPIVPDGLGTALKPAWEPIVLARKPLIGTVVENVLAHGTGALNVDGCRVGAGESRRSMTGGMARKANPVYGQFANTEIAAVDTTLGRWPANIVHDGSDEVLAAFPAAPGQVMDQSRSPDRRKTQSVYGTMRAGNGRDGEASADQRYGDRGGTDFAMLPGQRRGDSGSAARFFYSAKADADDRAGSKHPTVKPVDLMRWLVRLITPPGGVVLDPFAGTGTTGAAAWHEGFKAILVEREPEYQADISRRMALCLAGPEEKSRAILKARGKLVADAGPLFGGLEAAE